MSTDPEPVLSLVRTRGNVVALKPAHAVTPPPECAGNASAAIPSPDWDLLFKAVEARLGAVAGALLDGQDGLPRPGATVVAQVAMRECVAALQQLHRTLGDERRQHHKIESELLATDTALAHARVRLFEAEDQARSALLRASRDSLTELPNRGHFIERTDSALVNLQGACVSLAALYIDLDGFKLINDQHGHHIGDQVLQIVASRLVCAVRANDTIGRLGGDEFACLLTSLPSKKQLKRLARKLVNAVASPMQIGTLELTVRASIGIAIYPRDGETSKALLRSADEAMYRAKRQQSGFAFLDR